MKNLNKLYKRYVRVWYKKKWRNDGTYCDRRTHPIALPYRRYRRGKNRCVQCGAKIGKVKYVLKSAYDYLLDTIFSTNPMLAMLKKKGMVQCGKRKKR